MKELELECIQSNTSSPIDLCLDDQFFFHPIKGRKGEEKQRRARVFWDCLSLELDANRHALQGECPDCVKIEEDGSIPVQIPTRLTQFFSALRDLIEVLIPEKDKAARLDELKVDENVRLVRAGQFDFVHFSSWLAQSLMTLCAPLRDSIVRKMNEQISEGARTNDMDLLVQGFETLLSLLETMKLDVANYQSRSFKLLSITDTVPFLQDCFSKMQPDRSFNIKRYRKRFFELLTRPEYEAHPAARNVLPIILNGEEVDALPDTRCPTNVMTEEFANLRGIAIDRRPWKRRSFTNGMGRHFESVGEAKLRFSFLNDPGRVFRGVFSVLSRCAAPLVLGDPFLKSQKILTRSRHHLKRVPIADRNIWRCSHMGRPNRQFLCRMDGAAVPLTVDTGSDVNLLSLEYVRRHGWDTYLLPSDMGYVMFADGEIVKASAYVDKRIDLGEPGHNKIYNERFYIVEGLICDALIGDETTERMDLYNETKLKDLAHLWVDAEEDGYMDGFYAISWMDKIPDHVTKFLNDPVNYKIPDDDMQEILQKSLLQQGSTQAASSSSSSSSSPKRPRSWWRSSSKKQDRMNLQYQLLASGIWTKLGTLDGAEMEARAIADRAISNAGNDLLRLQILRDEDVVRRQKHKDEREQLLGLRKRLIDWQKSRSNLSP